MASRREFLKVAGFGVGATAASGLFSQGWGFDPSEGHDPQTDGDQVVPTFCELCFWKCGVLAHVKQGRVTKIVGNPAHPLSRGRLCPRGTGGAGLLYDPDRLKKPMIRREARGEQAFEEVSWDDALNETAKRLTEIKSKYGPEALALFSHGYGGSWFKHLMKAYGSGNITAPSYAQCRGARESAFELTFGSDVGSPEFLDLENSRVITLIGSHLGENMHNTQVQEFATAIDRGAQLIVVDPRYSIAAGKARYWLPIKPGTDIALLLAWAHVILREGLWDRDYVAQYAVGLEALQAHVADKTPEWAYVRTGIRPELIVETARVLAGARPASLVHPGRHTAWYGDDVQRGRAIAILNGLLGAWGRRGGIYLPVSTKVPAYPYPPYEHHPAAPPDQPVDSPFPFAGQTLAHGFRDASIPGNKHPYTLKAWMVYGTNLNLALPQPERTVQALQALDFVLTIDVLPAEIVGWSDVVLPEATYLERYDDLDLPPYKTGYVALRQPVVPPLHDSKPGWWIAKELGKRLGLEAYFPWEDVEAYLAARTTAADLDLVALAKTGVHEYPPQPIAIEEGVAPTFATPSGKIELFSQQMADAGLPPMPEFTAHEEPGPDEFRLLSGRAPTHTFGRTTNNRLLSEVMAENSVWVNARRAEELGLIDGERVVLVNQDGVKSAPIAVEVTQRIRPDCVYMVHGFGHRAKGLNFAKNRGADDNALVTRAKIDPAMGGTGMSVNFVRIEKVQA